MDYAQAGRAVQAYRQLIRIARHPEREPAWPRIIQDLRQADQCFRDIPHDMMNSDEFRLARQVASILMRHR